MELLSALTAYLPTTPDLMETLKFLCLFAGAFLVVCFLIKAVFGKKTLVNQAISTAMGIFAVYVMTVVVYTFIPSGLSRFLAPLPFVSFGDNVLYLLNVSGVEFPTLCREALSMIVLAFLVNVADGMLPDGKKIVSWVLMRFLTVAAAIVMHYFVVWLFNLILPDTIVSYAPMILLGTLIIMLSLGLLKFILGLILTTVNPLFGALYAFFFNNKAGKSLSKAVLSTLILSLVFYGLSYLGYGAISISEAALSSYIPVGIVLLILWYMIGNVL